MERLLEEKEFDGEWVKLMIIARDYGITPDEVRIFLTEKKRGDEKTIQDS